MDGRKLGRKEGWEGRQGRRKEEMEGSQQGVRMDRSDKRKERGCGR